MPKSRADVAKSRPAVETPGAGTDARPRGDRDRTRDGITISRWSLGLSLTIALTALTGAFTLVWDEVTDLRDTQVGLVSGLSRVEVEVRSLREEVRRDIGDLREEVRSDIGDFREEMRQFREEMRRFREEMRDSAASRETPDAAVQ